jgi:predicted CoA-binding protein
MRIHLPDSMKGAPSIDKDSITEILKTCKTIAVVGLSSNAMRPSFGVSEYMKDAGYRIIPVNPNEREVLGEKSYAQLEDVPEKIDIVDIFRRPEEVAAAVESAMRIGAKVIWMQHGVENEAAAEMARAAGAVVIEDSCILVEHRKRVASGG